MGAVGEDRTLRYGRPITLLFEVMTKIGNVLRGSRQDDPEETPSIRRET
jgi:hypothetical protein